jgi:uncharacterized protein YegL
MSMPELEFVNNPDPRCPVVLVLDTSYSMKGPKIAALNEGLQAFIADVLDDPHARQRVELAVVTFGGQVELVADFVPVQSIVEAKPLAADGGTPLGAAICLALDRLEARKSSYKENGISSYRPWLVLMTDGQPTDAVAEATRRIQAAEESHKATVWCVGVGDDVDMGQLSALSSRPPKKLQGLSFKEFFIWLSGSTKRVSGSRVGQQVKLDSTDSWEYI